MNQRPGFQVIVNLVMPVYVPVDLCNCFPSQVWRDAIDHIANKNSSSNLILSQRNCLTTDRCTFSISLQRQSHCSVHRRLLAITSHQSLHTISLSYFKLAHNARRSGQRNVRMPPEHNHFLLQVVPSAKFIQNVMTATFVVPLKNVLRSYWRRATGNKQDLLMHNHSQCN